ARVSAPLRGSASCPICLEFFRDPVSIHCGHHFCRACIERCWEWPTDRFACPRCRDTAPQRSLRPSPELARVLEIARRLSRGEALGGDEEEEEEGEEGCRRHREPLEVFCRQDGALLCAICRESRAHRAHDRAPEQIQARLQTLKDDRDKLLEFREAEMRRNWEFLEKTEAERQRILSHFQGLRLALEELSRHLLARLGRLEGDIATVQDENVTGLTQEISRLDARVQELEEKCEQPARTFLRDPWNPPPAVTVHPGPQHGSSPAPRGARRQQRQLGKRRDPPGTGAEPAAGPGPGTDPSVLGREGVTAGRRCWDVRVTPEGSWALGVATETPGSGGETLGSGGETPRIAEIGAETPGIGAETPGIGAETRGIGDETPKNGAGTPGIGDETPRSSGSGLRSPGSPGSGLRPPGSGMRPPRMEQGPPGSGMRPSGSPGAGLRPPGSPGSGLRPSGMEQGPPGSGMRPPRSPDRDRDPQDRGRDPRERDRDPWDRG
uniref:Uncharacterized protein n=1 Tax=Catharus ustulatus TaxID=91951 RepID=A0A8C3UM47_CATUS